MEKNDFWSEYLKWYQMWLEHTPYLSMLQNKVLSLLKEEKSFLDIGAGTGDIALAVADKVEKVICVEPADKMREIILKKAELEQKKIICYADTWEQIGEIGTYDFVLAAHSFYTMNKLENCLLKMLQVTKQKLLIMVRKEKKVGKLYSLLKEKLLENGFSLPEAKEKPALQEIVACLDNYQPVIEIMNYDCSHYYHSLSEAAQHWSLYLNLPSTANGILEKIFDKYLSYDGEHFFYPEEIEGAFVLVEKGGEKNN